MRKQAQQAGHFRVMLMASVSMLLVEASPVFAQQADEASPGEIIVTARKRDERLLDVPVAVTALGSTDLSRYGATDLSKIGQMIPQASFEKIGGGGNGATFTIRGVGSSSGDKGIEQTVAVNIDGVQSSRGKLSVLSFFDVQQVEVLKGPQALFFGKNSPGGVISVRSVDPGKTLEGYVRGGYEFKARERFLEGAFSVPVTPDLGIRVALRGSKTSGWMQNQAEAGANPFNPAIPLTPATEREPGSRELLGRLTINWSPSSEFKASFKFFAAHVKDDNELGASQVKCASGITNPTTLGVADPNGDCKVDGRFSKGAQPGVLSGSAWEGSRDGQPYSDTKAILSSLTLAYTGEKVSVTSVTGAMYLNSRNFDNYDGTIYARFTGYNPEKTRGFSQEVRIASSFDGPLNFTVGTYLETQKRNSAGVGGAGILTPDARNGQVNLWSRYDLAHTETYSAFGQLNWKINPQLELTGGARYTKEDKDLSIGNAFVNQSQLLAPGLPASILVYPEGQYINSKRSDENVSPEVSLTYKPTSHAMVYAAYKTGFKSGGLSSSSILAASATAENLKFKPEKARGFELGAKGEFFDRRLTLTATAYRYSYRDIQSTSFDSVAFAFKIKNAGRARTQGIEMDAQYRVTDALSLRSAVGYNRARYTRFVGADCYAGQTAALGCVGGLQDLSGTQLTFAPALTGNAGVTFDTPISNGINIGLSGDAIYTSSYWMNSTHNPLARQQDFWKLNASVNVHADDDRWELALIGRNLTNKYYGIYAPDKPGGPATGGEVLVLTGRPREVMLRATMRF